MRKVCSCSLIYFKKDKRTSKNLHMEFTSNVTSCHWAKLSIWTQNLSSSGDKMLSRKSRGDTGKLTAKLCQGRISSPSYVLLLRRSQSGPSGWRQDLLLTEISGGVQTTCSSRHFYSFGSCLPELLTHSGNIYSFSGL